MGSERSNRMASVLRVLRWIGGFVAVVLVVFVAIGTYMVTNVTGEPLPKPFTPGGKRETITCDAATGAKIELYGFITAETEVTFGQFFGGLEGWVGLQAMFRGATSDRHFWVPVQVMVIRHPEVGVILVDTGVAKEQFDAFGYYSVIDGGLNAGIWRDHDSRASAAGSLVEQLHGIGVAPEDVKHVIITHLHEDHLGELHRLPNATVHISRTEWEDRERLSYAPTYASVKRWKHFDYDSGSVPGFEGAKDLFADGTVIALPTPGHSLGHSAVLVCLGDHHALITGDAVYTMRHLDPDSLASFAFMGEQALRTYQDSVRRMMTLQDKLGDVIIIPPHDPFAYNRVALQEALADGRLDPEERKDLRARQAALYDDGHLRPEAAPAWKDGQLTSEIP